MEKRILTVLLGLAFVLIASCPRQESDSGESSLPADQTGGLAAVVTQGQCPVCGMPYATAAAEVHAGGRKFDSFPCWVEYADKNGLDPAEGEILDFPTRGGERSFVPLTQAYYVEAEFLESSMPPFLAAFKNPEQAQQFAKEQSSEVVGFNRALEIARQWFKVHGYRGQQDKPMDMGSMEEMGDMSMGSQPPDQSDKQDSQ